MTRTILSILSVLLFCSFTSKEVPTSTRKSQLNIYCKESNDLYQLLLSNGIKCVRFDDIESALKASKKGDQLLLLAKNYPESKTVIPDNLYEITQRKKLKVYVEFPDRLASTNTGNITPTKKERFVVTSNFFGNNLQEMSILDAGLYSYVTVPDQKAHVTGANVAGFDIAVYGLKDTPSAPILFEDSSLLVATTKLSDFNKSRYAPLKSWKIAISKILSHLSIDAPSNLWEPLVKPMYTKDEKLKSNAFSNAVEKGAEWYVKGRFLIHEDWKKDWLKYDTLRLPVGPPISPKLPSGDGSLGIMEGHYSYINPDGSQPYRYWLRADCVSETAMTFAIANNVKSNSRNLEIAKNLMGFLYNTDTFKTESSKNPVTSSYGLIGWADTHPYVYYGDDNARVILGSILAAELIDSNQWDTDIAKLIVSNYRTTGKNGFRKNNLREENIKDLSWEALFDRDFENPAPHFESWLWATYIWLYDKTGYEPLLEKAKKGLEITMNSYPEKWIWTNGIQQERARIILPLAWLVRVENTEQHQKWLYKIVDDLLQHQVACGALREELGEGSKGRYGAPKTNKAYGHNEAPVIHTNGDPLADMLYTSNFAFFALNEAAEATDNPTFKEAVNQLADFMVRIQSSSTGRADLDGVWFRSFDFKNWEYYGSNADHGWGAWGTLTGWTQSFITTTLALKSQQTSYWDKTKNSSIGSSMNAIIDKMLTRSEEN